ncbi:MAG: metalloregulator ArsR/SmtB family transcription factor [Candidatus Bathyarchaeota archaeon]|nr:metalloregulator ArsR/SmtB family transcription factor [Candidatus Bathyarchaeota archaeon]
MPPRAESNLRLKARVFYALSDAVRLEILEFLRDGEKCVCEIVPHLELVQPVVSRHLRILRDLGLVRCRKDGNKRLYSVTDAKIFGLVDALSPELADFLAKEIMEYAVCR